MLKIRKFTKRRLVASAAALGLASFGLATQFQNAANARVERKTERISASQVSRRAADAPKRAGFQLMQAAAPRDRSGTWNIDPLHSSIGFSIRHMGVNEVKGTFNDFEGAVTGIEGDLAQSSVRFSAKVASVDTEVKPRDEHLRSPDFFDAATFPTLSFASKKVEKIAGDEMYRVTGDLTLRGVTKSVAFPFQLFGPVVDGFGFTRGGIEGNLVINRQDYGVKYNQKYDGGGLVVADVVRVHLNLEATKAGTGPRPAGA